MENNEIYIQILLLCKNLITQDKQCMYHQRCPICFEDVYDMYVLETECCSSIFHRDCLMMNFTRYNRKKCPQLSCEKKLIN